MKIVLNGSEVVELEDRRTRRGHRMISCSPGAHLNPVPGVVVFFEDPQVGAYPWISYVKLDASGEPDLTYAPTRMPLSKSRVTHVTA